MDLLPDMVCVVDADGRFVFLNKAAEKVLGYKPEELIGRLMKELVYAEDLERTNEIVKRLHEGYQERHFENSWVRKDGRLVRFMWSAQWYQDEGLRVAVARDITLVHRASRISDTLYRIAQAGREHDSFEGFYREAAKIVHEQLPFQYSHLALWNKESETATIYSISHGVEAHVADGPEVLDPDSALARVIRQERPLLCSSDAMEIDPRQGEACGNWIGAPLIAGHSLLGALSFEAGHEQTPFANGDVELLKEVAAEVASVMEQHRTRSVLAFRANYDPLTGLPGRLLFCERADTALKQARQSGESLGMLYLDIDGFKLINDNQGHEKGDAILRQFASRLAQMVRTSDLVARMSGDEFVVLLPHLANPDYLGILIQKIEQVIAEPFNLGDGTIRISASIGSAIFPKDSTDRDALLRIADLDMYRKKKAKQGDFG